MKTLPLSEVRMHLGDVVDAVERTDREIVITRNGRPAAVLVSPDEYHSWKESVAVRESPGLLAEVKRGLKALETGKAGLYTLAELLD